MKYAFITQHKNAYPVSLQCQVLGVSRNGYYQYRKNRDGKPEDPVHQEMIEWVQDIAKSSDDNYGSRRMKKALNVLGYPVSLDKARKLMREANVQVRHRKKYKVTTNSNHKQPVFENLVERKFDIDRPDQVYAADITYLWTQEGWLYLAVVIDLCTRKQVSLRSRERFWDIRVPKIDSIFDDHYCPGRPACVALRYAPLVCITRQLPQMAGRDCRMPTLFPLWRASARRANSAA